MKTYICQRIKHLKHIKKIRKEASRRDFYRLFFDHGTLIAMVYPEQDDAEISKISYYTALFQKNRIPVPEIIEIMDNRMVLQEDLGEEYVQKRFSSMDVSEKRKILDNVVQLLFRLQAIPRRYANSVLDHEKMIREMDFFLKHFARNFFQQCCSPGDLQEEVYGLVYRIQEVSTFAHRDFHSRNMLFHRGQIYLIDFQDALIAPAYYDLVSIAFDAYLDLKSHKDYLFQAAEKAIGDIQRDQFFLTALQRNIKALGTFGFQVIEKRNLSYRKYIRRTIRHLHFNALAGVQVPKLLGCLQKIDFTS